MLLPPENRLPMLDVINFALDRFNEKPGQLRNSQLNQ